MSDLGHDPRFARDIAIELGAEPDTMAVVPIRREGAVVGVLEILDPAPEPSDAGRSVLDDLGLLARHAASALEVSSALC